MKPETRRCKCLHCKLLFAPDYRNRERQKYCSTPACQAASKRARQQRWLSKPENRDHFCGEENVQRVREWRAAHPGYWKRSPRRTAGTLQDACSAQPSANQEIAPVALPALCPGRYKMSAGCKRLCWWGLSPNSPTVRYKTTSSFSSGA